jgi:hypothetical protein
MSTPQDNALEGRQIRTARHRPVLSNRSLEESERAQLLLANSTPHVSTIGKFLMTNVYAGRIGRMPRPIARIPYAGKILEPRRLTKQDWLELEDALGQKIPTNALKSISFIVAMMMMLVQRQQNALSVTRARKKLDSFQKKAENLRSSIWYADDPFPEMFGPSISANYSKPDQLKNLSRKTIEARFFCVKKPMIRDTESILELLAHALDGVIATCDLASREFSKPGQHVNDQYVFTRFAIILRDIFKFYGLPHKLRKDTDKMVDDEQRSPFVRFLDKVRIKLQLPSVSRDALTMRILRLEPRLKNRVRLRAKTDA